MNSFDVFKLGQNNFKSEIAFEEAKAQLSDILEAMFHQNPAISYYQGVNDTMSILLLAFGPNAAFHFATQFHMLFFRDLLQMPF